MQANAILKLFAAVAAMLIGLLVVQHVLTGYGNNLSSLFKIMAFGGVMLGLMQPKMSLFFLVFVTAYLDLFKRFLLFFGRVHYGDIITVLSFAPLILLGICLGVLLKRGRGGVFLDRAELRLFWVSVLIGGAILGGAMMTMGSFMGGLVAGANSGAYVPLILFAGILLADRKSQEAFLRWTVLLFVPVAIYGIKQTVTGLSMFEIDYLQSGMTRIAGVLEEGMLRPFSTLNSPHAFSIMMVTCFGISLHLAFRGERYRHIFKILVILFLATTFTGGVTRTAWGMAGLIIGGMIFFRSKGSTLFLYGSAAVGFGLLVIFSDSILGNLGHWQDDLVKTSNQWMQRAGSMGTMSERLVGMASWSRSSDLWSWFGVDMRNYDEKELPHDMIGQILVSKGAVGLCASLILGVGGLYYAHRTVLRIKDAGTRSLCVTYLSVIFALILSGMIAGSHTAVFPLNFYFWLLIGLLLRVARAESEALAVRAKAQQAERVAAEPEARPIFHPGAQEQISGQIPAPVGRIRRTGTRPAL